MLYSDFIASCMSKLCFRTHQASVHKRAGKSLRNVGVGLGQENDVEREFQIHRTERDYALAEFWKWTIALLIGVVMGCIGFVVDLGIELLNTFKYTSTATVIQQHGMLLSYCLHRLNCLHAR